MKNMAAMMLGGHVEDEGPDPAGRGYTGKAPESICCGNRDALLPGTPDAVEAAGRALGEGSLQSGVAFKVPMGGDLRVHGISTPHEVPRFTMWGESELTERD